MTLDHATYLSPAEGQADIFFPTDFEGLKAYYESTQRVHRKEQAARGGDAKVSQVLVCYVECVFVSGAAQQERPVTP